MLTERDAQCDQLIQIVTQWENDPGAPKKFCLTLNYEYTTKNLAFCNLKGDDKAQVNALLRSNFFNLHLALIEKHMSDDAVYRHNSYGYNRYGYDNGSDDSDGECGRQGGAKHHEMEDFQDSEVKMKGLDIDIDEEILNNDEALFDSNT